MRIKVVILSTFLSPFRSGAEACAEEVALALCDRFDITIITAKMRSDLPREDVLQGKVKVIRVGFGCSFDKWLYPFMAPFAAKKLKPDLLHAVLETFAGVALHMCTVVIPKAKQILTLQTTNSNFLRKHILRTPHRVTAISTILAQQAARLGRTDVTIISNGIPYDEIRASCDRATKVYGHILFVGRLEPMKGVDTLLKAFASISLPDVHLHIVGEGSERAALENLARELGLQNRTRFMGRLQHGLLWREYAEAEIFCGLSRSEALGNVFLEAQAAGCVTIATRVGGIPEIVKECVTGLLVPPDDVAAASATLKQALTDENLRARLTAAAIEHAKAFDWNPIAQRYADVYERLLVS